MATGFTGASDADRPTGMMAAMRLGAPGARLTYAVMDKPRPGPGEALIRIEACGVCRTDLHVTDGDLPQRRAPLTPGHEIVGVVEALGGDAAPQLLGRRVGVGWLGGTCAVCTHCRRDEENLCDAAEYTGYTRDGGFATHVLADARFISELPKGIPATELAPLMCAGLIGWRSLRFAGSGRALGLYGFGAAAHIILQIARQQGRRVYAFTRPGDMKGQEFARRLGADWAGGSDDTAPEALDAAIIYAPVGALVPQALRSVRKGGRVVCAGIHMSDIPAFPYAILWGERSLCSVANLTRADARGFLALVARLQLRVHTQVYPLTHANRALDDLRAGRVAGAAVLVPEPPGAVSPDSVG